MNNLLILGATSDMAQAIAKKHAAEGWSLTLAARSAEKLEPIAGDLRVRSGAEIKVMEFDASDFASHRAFYEALEEKPERVIACFGYMGDQEVARHDFDEARNTIDVNFTGMVSILSLIADEFETCFELL